MTETMLSSVRYASFVVCRELTNRIIFCTPPFWCSWEQAVKVVAYYSNQCIISGDFVAFFELLDQIHINFVLIVSGAYI